MNALWDACVRRAEIRGQSIEHNQGYSRSQSQDGPPRLGGRGNMENATCPRCRGWPTTTPRSAYARLTMATKRAPLDFRILPSWTGGKARGPSTSDGPRHRIMRAWWQRSIFCSLCHLRTHDDLVVFGRDEKIGHRAPVAVDPQALARSGTEPAFSGTKLPRLMSCSG